MNPSIPTPFRSLPDPPGRRTRCHSLHDILVAALDPEAFKAAFLAWVHTLAAVMPGDVIAIDGKTLRQTFDTAADKAAIPMVSAWAAAQGLCLGQIKTDAKSNEITAIPTLLEVLALAGRIVTIDDARGCQKDIARAIHVRRVWATEAIAPGCTTATAGRACAASSSSSPSARSGITRPARAGCSSAACRPTPPGSPASCAGTGPLRTASIGSLMWP